MTPAPLTVPALLQRSVKEWWVIASSDEIPTLPSGKFDRKSLRQWIIEGKAGVTTRCGLR